MKLSLNSQNTRGKMIWSKPRSETISWQCEAAVTLHGSFFRVSEEWQQLIQGQWTKKSLAQSHHGRLIRGNSLLFIMCLSFLFGMHKTSPHEQMLWQFNNTGCHLQIKMQIFQPSDKRPLRKTTILWKSAPLQNVAQNKHPLVLYILVDLPEE